MLTVVPDQPVKIILHRIIEDQYGTHGQLRTEDGTILCCTIERQWLDNKPNVSCIPVGEYQCVPHDSAKHPKTWEITGVPGRSEILIHTGNVDLDSTGCVIVGTASSVTGVVMSAVAMAKLREVLPVYFMLDVCEEKDDALDQIS